MEILIEDKQNHYKIDYQEIRTKAKRILDALECRDGELSILIVGDQEIAKLNEVYLCRPKPTNVLAFPMQQGQFKELNPNLLGDVVISVDTAAREAEGAGVSLETRFDQLLIHGILHLFGFDHEKTLESASAMQTKEKQLLELL